MERELFPQIEIPMSWEAFQSLPRHPAWRYEFLNAQLRLSVRTHYRHCRLEIQKRLSEKSRTPATSRELQAGLTLAPWDATPLSDFTPVFQSAFERVAPFSSFSEDERLPIIKHLLQGSVSGITGQTVAPASFALKSVHSPTPVGGILITLFPTADFGDFSDPRWSELPPANALQECWGTPHLTWIVVDQEFQNRGIAATLLSHALNALSLAGYHELFSTMMVGNHSSTFWHWKNGFELVPQGRQPATT